MNRNNAENRIIPWYIYASAAGILLALFMLIIIPEYGTLLNDYDSIMLLLAGEAAFLVAALFIRKWKSSESTVIELLQSLSFPVIAATVIEMDTKGWIIHGIWLMLFVCSIYFFVISIYNIIIRKKWNNRKFILKVIAVALYRVRGFITWVIWLMLLFVIFAGLFPVGNLTPQYEPIMV